MPTPSPRRLARLLTATTITTLLAAGIITTWPSTTAHPPERIALTGRAVPINPTALPPELASTTTTTSTPTPVPVPTIKSKSQPRLQPVAPPTWAPNSSLEAIAAHFDGPLYDQAVAVARCESTFDPNAIGGNNYGLFQINKVHAADWANVIGRDFWSSWMDPFANAAYARHLYDDQGWAPWACRP